MTVECHFSSSRRFACFENVFFCNFLRGSFIGNALSNFLNWLRKCLYNEIGF